MLKTWDIESRKSSIVPDQRSKLRIHDIFKLLACNVFFLLCITTLSKQTNADLGKCLRLKRQAEDTWFNLLVGAHVRHTGIVKYSLDGSLRRREISKYSTSTLILAGTSLTSSPTIKATTHSQLRTIIAIQTEESFTSRINAQIGYRSCSSCTAYQ